MDLNFCKQTRNDLNDNIVTIEINFDLEHINISNGSNNNYMKLELEEIINEESRTAVVSDCGQPIVAGLTAN